MLDGGLATELEARGFDLGDRLWSARLLVEQPGAISRLHHDYLEAGADCITSASYQATVEGFVGRGLGRNAAEGLLRLSVDLAIEARDSFWRHYQRRGDRQRGRLKPLVAASIGPYGAYLADGSEYTGDYGLGKNDRLAEEALIVFHRRRMRILAGGADLLACETIPCRVEARALARLLDETSSDEVPGPPAWLSFSCRDGRRLSDGSELAATVKALDGCRRIVAFGVNCTAPRYVSSLVARLRDATEKSIIVYPNSGETWDATGKCWLDGDRPVDFAAGSVAWYRAGARLLGGCCRTRPRDVREIRARLAESLVRSGRSGIG